MSNENLEWRNLEFRMAEFQLFILHSAFLILSTPITSISLIFLHS